MAGARRLRKLWLTSDGMNAAANGVLAYQFDQGVTTGTSQSAQGQIPSQKVRAGERWLVQYVTWDCTPGFSTAPIGRLIIVDDQTQRVVNAFRGNRGQAGPFMLEEGETLKWYCAGLKPTDTEVINIRGYVLSVEDDDPFFQGMVLQALASAQQGTPATVKDYAAASIELPAPVSIPNASLVVLTGLQQNGDASFFPTADKITIPAAYADRQWAFVVRCTWDVNATNDRLAWGWLNGATAIYNAQHRAPVGIGAAFGNFGSVPGLFNNGDTIGGLVFQNSGGALLIENFGIEIYTVDWN